MSSRTKRARALAVEELKVAASEPSAMKSFIESHTFPIIEGSHCTFVFIGEADGVNLRHFIYSLPSNHPFKRIEGTDLWYLTVNLPDNSRVEYKFEVMRGGSSEWIEDPLNPLKAHDPFGANSVCQSYGYEIPSWTREDEEARPGSLYEMALPSKALRRDCDVTLYLPARFRRTARYPLLIVHDGGDYLRYSSLKTVLDNLIHRLEVAEMIVAMLHPRDRLKEYANSAAHSRFITEELVPHLEEKYPLIEQPAGRGLMGASFGAVAALSAAWRNPIFYGHLILQSGSFAFTDIGPARRPPVFRPVIKFVNGLRDRPRRVADKVFVSCGIYESLIYENRSMVPVLQTTGMDVRYVEARDGHNWENWRDRLRDALSWHFPGPLRMVYE